ncbi:MAG: hypothetical protein ACI9F9_003451 [Candidatus Paceibacteria bacterium]|jgi:hypothetical protein
MRDRLREFDRTSAQHLAALAHFLHIGLARILPRGLEGA